MVVKGRRQRVKQDAGDFESADSSLTEGSVGADFQNVLENSGGSPEDIKKAMQVWNLTLLLSAINA